MTELITKIDKVNIVPTGLPAPADCLVATPWT